MLYAKVLKFGPALGHNKGVTPGLTKGIPPTATKVGHILLGVCDGIKDFLRQHLVSKD